MCIHIQHWNDW